MEGYFLFFVSVVDIADEINANQQCQQKYIKSHFAVRIYYIQDSLCQKNNTDCHMGDADLFQVCRQVTFINMFQMTLCVKSRLAKESKNASGEEINAR